MEILKRLVVLLDDLDAYYLINFGLGLINLMDYFVDFNQYETMLLTAFVQILAFIHKFSQPPPNLLPFLPPISQKHA